MDKDTKENITFVTQRDIAELKAIYEDYLYIVRQYELVFKYENIDDLAARLIKDTYPECKNPRNFTIPWTIKKANAEEKLEFEDYAANNIKGDGKKTYIFLQHLRDEENSDKPPIFAIPPYTNSTISMQLPAMFEDFTIFFPEGATLANTEFLVDGRYKTEYLGIKNKDTPLADCVNNPELVTEITIMLCISEYFRINNFIEDQKFRRMIVNVYASEMVGRIENISLEMLGSFAEKISDICHARYHEKKRSDDIQKAQKDGFLSLPDNFGDYLNIRNFLRHQWDTLNDLDDFSLKQSQENRRIRSQRAASLLKCCDKTVYQRMIYFVDALHQMQQIINELAPDRLMRSINESNTKFVKRIKAASRQNPDQLIDVEMNYRLEEDNYKKLAKTLQNKKIFPNIRTIDDFSGDISKLGFLKDCETRSMYLRNFHLIECYALGFCQNRNLDKKCRNAWNYLRDIGIITPDECEKLHDYTTLRNNLAHDYFDKNLRTRLNKIDDVFNHDMFDISQKLYNAGPEVRKICDDVYKYEHTDGNDVIIDYITHNRETSKHNTEISKNSGNTNAEIQKEIYDNGIEIETDGENIIGINLPNVYINIKNRSTHWNDRTYWYANAKNFNVLKTRHCTIRTDKNLNVTGLFQGRHSMPFAGGDNISIDCRHDLLLDKQGKIQAFHFKNDDNENITAKFAYNDDNNSSLILFADGTSILFSDKDMMITHNNEPLTFENRKKFAETYNVPTFSHLQSLKQNNGR